MQKPSLQEQNGRAHAYEQYVMPQQAPTQYLVPQQQLPQIPAVPPLSEHSFLTLQQGVLGIQALQMVLPLTMSSPAQFLNSVSQKMDDLTTFVEGYEENKIIAEFEF